MFANRLSLKTNFVWTLSSNIVYSVSQWGLIVALAKLSSPETVGLYALALAITTPVFMFTNLGLATVQATDTHEENRFGDYLGFRLLCSIISLVIIFGILEVGGFNGDTIKITFLVSFAKFFESISDVGYGLMQKQERLDLMAQSLMLRGGLSLVVMVFAIYYFQNLTIALTVQVFVWAGILWVFDLSKVHHWQPVRPHFSPSTLKNLFVLSLPLGLVAGLNSFSTQVPRYALAYYVDQRDLGIFSAVASLTAIGNLIAIALSRPALPRLSHLYAQGLYQRFKRLYLQLTGIGSIVGVLGILASIFWGKLFLSTVYTPEYAAYTNILLLTVIGLAVDATFTYTGTALGATRQFSIQAYIHLLKSATVGIASFILVSRWGLLGAAWAVLIGKAFSSLVYSFILWQTLHKAEISQDDKLLGGSNERSQKSGI